MSTTVDFKTIFESLPLPSAVCTPIYNAEKTLTDIRIDSVNQQFLLATNKSIQNDCLFSTVKDILTPDIDWLALAKESLTHKTEKSFYSLLAKAYIKITASSIKDEKILLCITDISREKETEQQLRRQNSRLEELTSHL
ncbi:MAG: hypothetical protein K6G00_03960 [Treponema sp.]|nr:hypothetical protein [Treponema sp.]